MITHVKRYISFSLGPLLSYLLGIIVVPMLTWFISPAHLGKATLFISTYIIISSISRFPFEQLYARHYHGDLRFKMMGLSATFSIMISLTIALAFKYSLGDHFGETKQLSLLIPMLVLMVFSGLSETTLNLENKPLCSSKIIFGGKIAEFVAIASLLSYPVDGFYALVGGKLTNILFTSVLGFHKTKDSWKLARVGIVKIKPHLSFVTPLFITAIAITALSHTAPLIIKIVRMDSQLGTYANAFKMAGALMALRWGLSSFMYSTFYQQQKDIPKPDNHFSFVESLSSVFAPIVILIILITPFIKSFIPSYYHGSLPLVPYIACALIFLSISDSFSYGLKYLNKNSISMVSSLASLILFIAVGPTILLKHGIIGLAQSLLISTLIHATITISSVSILWTRRIPRKTIIAILTIIVSISTPPLISLFVLFSFIALNLKKVFLRS